MGVFRRKKEKKELNVSLSGGLYLERPRNARCQRPLFSCLPKGVLNFLVVFGSLGGFISAFDMECNYLIPAIVLFLSAMYFSSLFALKKSGYKDFGYIVYFSLYVHAILLFKSYVNSGVAAVLNIVKQHGEVYFGLNTGTEFAEQIDDRYWTITMAFIFIGIFEIILLNIYLLNYMSLKFTIFICMPLYVFPIYLREEPDLFFVLCMLCGLTGIYIFKNSGHFKDGKSRLGYEKTGKGRTVEISYTQNNKVYLGILLGALCCTLVVGLCTVFYDEFEFRRTTSENKYKADTGDAVAGFLMLGFRSFYGNSYSRGGMSGGKLGNITAIRPDNQTDLVVRFAPFSKEPVYLKAYTGLYYDHSEWEDWYQWSGALRGVSAHIYEESMYDEAGQLARAFERGVGGQARAVMEVKNMGADSQYVYYPYFTIFDDYTKYTDSRADVFVGSKLGEVNRFTFYPNIGRRIQVDSRPLEEYLAIEDANVPSVDRFIAAAGVHAGQEDVVERVVSYFNEAYSYSYNPGWLPRGSDVVNYFLDQNKKGVCYHFASSAALVFRRLGIPARYVEGYAFGYNSVLDGTVCEDLNYEDYYSGYSELGKTAVMEVEVTDANAHAWVEIYKEGEGWIVVDPTPTTMEESEEGGFWESLSGFLQERSDLELGGDLSMLNLGFLKSDAVRMAILLLTGAAALAFLIRLFVRRLVRWKSWHTKDLSRNLLWYYRDVCRKKARRDPAFARLSVPSEQIAYLLRTHEATGDGGQDTADDERVIRCFEKICFCPEKPARDEYEYVLGVLKRVGKR